MGVVAADNAVGEIDKSIKKKIPYMVWSDTEYEKVMQEAIRLQALGKAATALKLAKIYGRWGMNIECGKLHQ